MVPTEEKKKEKVPTVPDFIDDNFIKTLPKEKRDYWKNRKAGKRGMPDLRPKAKVVKTADDIVMGFDNEGNMVAKTRQVRRQKPPTENKYTKKSPKRKK